MDELNTLSEIDKWKCIKYLKITLLDNKISERFYELGKLYKLIQNVSKEKRSLSICWF